uniref:Uncharacterized protein n=1 Tax=Pithovirus LCPAC404 TaxID=2506597 RepID=A0A481ZE50_9VIRU|nr:MAG: hypothetical protein LCPAC404_02660 [Pithovirus LCPAC404]
MPPEKIEGYVNAFRTLWDIRQDPMLYEINTQLYGTTDLNIKIDRIQVRFPECTKNTFELPPHRLSKNLKSYTCYVHLTEWTHSIIPSSHTDGWTESFDKEYSTIETSFGEAVPFSSWDEDDSKSTFVDIKCDKNAIMIMNDAIFRRVDSRNNTNNFQFCVPISYSRCYESKDLGDRIRSFLQGIPPYRLLNGIIFTPFPCGYKEYSPDRGISPLRIHSIRRMYTLDSNSFITNKGQLLMVEVAQKDYEPPYLSLLGYKLLGIVNWTNSLNIVLIDKDIKDILKRHMRHVLTLL